MYNEWYNNFSKLQFVPWASSTWKNKHEQSLLHFLFYSHTSIAFVREMIFLADSCHTCLSYSTIAFCVLLCCSRIWCQKLCINITFVVLTENYIRPNLICWRAIVANVFLSAMVTMSSLSRSPEPSPCLEPRERIWRGFVPNGGAPPMRDVADDDHLVEQYRAEQSWTTSRVGSQVDSAALFCDFRYLCHTAWSCVMRNFLKIGTVRLIYLSVYCFLGFIVQSRLWSFNRPLW